MTGFTRRDALSVLVANFIAAGLPAHARASEDTPGQDGLVLGDPEPFDSESLKDRAAELAKQPWEDARSPHGDILQKIDYDAFQAIVYDRKHALWDDDKGGDPIQLFHMGRYFQEPVTIHVVEDGQARQILYRQAYFDMPDDSPARALPQDIGFAGFRIEAPDQKTDWMAFLGASYFRSSGELDQYGLSARGLAIDTAMPTPEEFPRFSHFWLERVPGEDRRVVVHALLDSPSVTGAYRIDCRNDGRVTSDVSCTLYPRKPIARLGVAPLTSMYWYSETESRQAIDWRPEIHDSDGLAIWTGGGERIWRPLNNPPHVVTNAFSDQHPKGFGLLQRDRKFDHYQDDGVFYDRRPSVWIEPTSDWGGGEVQLVEMPTDSEIHDNIVIYWAPKEKVEPGTPLDFSYRMFWTDEEPYPSALGRVVATHIGIGGVPGQDRPENAVRFVIDFEGPSVEGLKRGDAQPKITLSRGEVMLADSHPVVGQDGLYRAFFDTIVTGEDPIDMRLFVERKDGGAVSETWLYQHFPRPYT